MTAHYAEPLLNAVLAELLDGMNVRWKVWPERQCLVGSQRCPDIVVTSYGRQPVVIENEWAPAVTVEQDAKSRLGEVLDPGEISNAGEVQTVVALRSPARLRALRTSSEVHDALADLPPDSRLEYAYFAGKSSQTATRFPASGFISGTVEDLAVFVDHAGVSSDALHKSVLILDQGVSKLVGLMRDATDQSDDWKTQVASILRQDFDESKLAQMLGIAATIFVNAMVFQERLAGNHGVRNLAQMRSAGDLNQRGVLDEWNRILGINYWSIFHLACELAAGLNPPRGANACLRAAAETAAELVDIGVAHSHDLAGTVFQRFIGDRKYLASFFTRPESATLLASLAIPEDGWASEERAAAYRVADYACGTGTLIHAAYVRINSLVETKGGNPADYHKTMIEEALTACDIVPSAAHLTAAMLSSVHPNVLYDKSRVLIPEYGKSKVTNRIALGSLDLLSDSNTLPSLFPMSAPQAVAARSGRVADFSVETAPESQDLVIMNPPFTRAMSDWEPGAEGQWKQYRGLGTTAVVQRKMMEEEKKLGRTNCYHGSAGIASAFAALADKMCKKGGQVGLVLPLTAIHGGSWTKMREMLASCYEDIRIVGIAGYKAIDSSWSADTKLAEVLVVARKSESSARGRAIFVTLRRRPANAMEATEVARAIKQVDRDSLKCLEDGPFGGSRLMVGDDVVGQALEAPVTGAPWVCCPVLDASVVQVAHQLANGLLWLPRVRREDASSVSVLPVGQFAKVGWAANNIANNRTAAFDKHPITGEPTYPMLWHSKASSQRTMVVDADMQGSVREGKAGKAARIWQNRSWVHHNCDFGFTSESLGAAFTDGRTIGGRAWPNVQLENKAQEKLYCLWGNSTLGLILYWYHSSRQQVGRGLMPVTAIRTLPCLDITALEPAQLKLAASVFDQMAKDKFRPAYLADQDDTRMALDRRVLRDVLGLDWDLLRGPLEVVRRKWCREPTVRGAKPLD